MNFEKKCQDDFACCKLNKRKYRNEVAIYGNKKFKNLFKKT